MRQNHIQTAQETLAIINNMSYQTPDGQQFEIPKLPVSKAITPAEWPNIIADAKSIPELPSEAEVEITTESTLDAIKRMGPRTIALNFASAKHVGGGFLAGSQAQEESLCRSSTLYDALQRAPEYYDANRTCLTNLYTDYAILSQDVTFFRDDSSKLIPAHMASVLTMPAPNLSALSTSDMHLVEETFRRRMRNIFALTIQQHYPNLILGAWGCGIFGNNPETVAKLFWTEMKVWRKKLRHIVFAVLDKSEPFAKAMRNS